MALTLAQQAAREGKITAGFAPALMAGNNPEIFDKYVELIGDPTWVPPDFDYDWPVQFGSFLESFTIDWHERKTQQAITRRGEVINHPTKPYVCATLDGYRAFDDCVLDCKVSVIRKLDDIIAYYTPQLIVQRACLQCTRAALLIVHMGSEVHEYQITTDPDYEAKVWERIDQFWHCVTNMIEPVEMPRVVPPEQWRTIDLDTLEDKDVPNWAGDMRAALALWDDNKDAAEIFDTASKDAKKLLPDDVGTLMCGLEPGRVTMKRNRANAISIKRGG